MTPKQFLAEIRRLAHADDMAGIMAFNQANLTEALLREMTPHQRRLAHAATHVAADSLGIGAEGTPDVPIDDLVDAAS